MPAIPVTPRVRPPTRAGQLRHFPRKRFGQHFITDSKIHQKIVRAAEIVPGDTVLEIGPGLGHLTSALSDAGAQVVAVEIDPDLVARLTERFNATPNVHVLQGDILARPPERWIADAGLRTVRYIVVANLPYYITSAVLRHLLEAHTPPTRLVVMVQREVAQQLTSAPPNMNLLALSVQFYAEPRIVARVPAGAFFPPPKVDSAIVRMDVLPMPRHKDPERFFKVARAGFSSRRKQLRNSLAAGLKMATDQIERALAHAHIEPTRRAETLTMQEWLRLVETLSNSL